MIHCRKGIHIPARGNYLPKNIYVVCLEKSHLIAYCTSVVQNYVYYLALGRQIESSVPPNRKDIKYDFRKSSTDFQSFEVSKTG